MTVVLRDITTDVHPAVDHHDRSPRALREVFHDTPLAERPNPGHWQHARAS